ncbi:MAG TPA: UDP-N-acetylglucosamine 1-carboxyvinyltransferase, partial [Bacillota bacterium]
MARLVVRGGFRLHGRVRVGGRKNSAVAVIPAALLADGPSILENIPTISDVATYIAILEAMGVEVERLSPHRLRINPTT